VNEQFARLIQLVLAGRPEALTEALLKTLPEAEARAYREAEEVFARYVAMAAPAVEPSMGLKARVLANFKQKASAKSTRALIVLDMIRDHLNEGAPLEVPRARLIVPALAKKIRESREEGVPVVFVVDEHADGDPDLESWGSHAIAGTNGNDVWPDLGALPTDRIIKKNTYSAFSNTDLQSVLNDLKCDSLVLTGCLTEIGMMATATDALQRGYAVEIPVATQAGISEVTEGVTLSLLHVMPPYGAARAELLARVQH